VIIVSFLLSKPLQEPKERLRFSYLFVIHDLNVAQLLCDRVLVMCLGRIIESGSAVQVFAAPAHPYTRALLSAIPKSGARSTRIALTGEPRSPIDPDSAVCRLYGRCARATDLCRSAAPPLRRVATGQHVACHHAVDEIETASAASLAIAASS
jgi:peptide/nickel transport system ATP-binding protein